MVTGWFVRETQDGVDVGSGHQCLTNTAAMGNCHLKATRNPTRPAPPTWPTSAICSAVIEISVQVHDTGVSKQAGATGTQMGLTRRGGRAADGETGSLDSVAQGWGGLMCDLNMLPILEKPTDAPTPPARAAVPSSAPPSTSGPMPIH